MQLMLLELDLNALLMVMRNCEMLQFYANQDENFYYGIIQFPSTWAHVIKPNSAFVNHNH